MDVLIQIRAKYRFPKVPVILFSASSQESDIDSSYQAGCNAYLVKPNDPERFKTLVSVINEFWLKENRCSRRYLTSSSLVEVGSQFPSATRLSAL